jgi:hypothetical protein
MDRNHLEDRIRASLKARAGDVEPTPVLWEEVDRKISRRRWWQAGLVALSGVAAVVAVLLAIPLFSVDRTITIDPADTPTTRPTDGIPGDGAPTRIVTTDGVSLYEIDPATGAVVRELRASEGFLDAQEFGAVAVRPASAPGETVVAATVRVEGNWEVRVFTFDADGARTDWTAVAEVATPAAEPAVAPTVVWSADGAYLAWTATDASGSAVWVSAWPSTGTLAVEVTDLSGIESSPGDVRLQAWVGDPAAGSTFWLTTLGAQLYTQGVTAAPFAADGAPSEYVVEQGGVSDVGFLGDRTAVMLVARSSGSQDAEGGTLQLWVEPMDDMGPFFDLPDGFPGATGSAAPGDAWLTAAGDTVVVGNAGRAWLLTVPGATIESRQVTATVELPEGTLAASAAPRIGTTPGGDATPGTPTETATAGPSFPVPGHAIRVNDREFELVEFGSSDAPPIAWGAPTGLPVEYVPVDVIVAPGGTADDFATVELWNAGDSYLLAYTIVRGGAIVDQALFPEVDQIQQDGLIGDPTPVFAPTGDWVAWVENTAGGAEWTLRAVAWTPEGPATGAARTDNAGWVLAVDAPVAAADWVVDTAGADGTFQSRIGLRPLADGGAWLEVSVEQQADGALAIPADGGISGIDADGLSGIATVQDGATRLGLAATPGGWRVLTDLGAPTETAIEVTGLPADAVALTLVDAADGVLLVDLDGAPWLVSTSSGDTHGGGWPVNTLAFVD